MQLQFLGSGHTSGMLFQLACFLSLGRVLVMKRMQGHTILSYISSKINIQISVRAADRGPKPAVMPVKPVEMSWPLQQPWEK